MFKRWFRKHRLLCGATLLEVAVSALIMALIAVGVSGGIRTLRQAHDCTAARGDAQQAGRVAMDRIAEKIRAAQNVLSISAPDDNDGHLIVVDFDGINYSFERDAAANRLLYGNDIATDELAVGVTELRFKGYNNDGQVSHLTPSEIESVRIELVVSTNTGDAITLNSCVRIRYECVLPQANEIPRIYASDYQLTKGAGIQNYWRAYGEPDGAYARLENMGSGGQYKGFIAPKPGTIHYVSMGFYMKFGGNADLEIRLHHGLVQLMKETYDKKYFKRVDDEWGWVWLDVTDRRATWDETDIPLLKIEFRDSSGNPDVRFDSVGLRVGYFPLETITLWANQQGTGVPNEWTNPEEACGSSDNVFAEAQWERQADEISQCYELDYHAGGSEILQVDVLIEGYIDKAVTPGKKNDLHLHLAPPGEDETYGVVHVLDDMWLKPELMSPGVKKTAVVDVSNSHEWTWHLVRSHELRLSLVTKSTGAKESVLRTDTLRLRLKVVAAEAEEPREITRWSESPP